MALKKKISKADFEKLPEVLQTEYKANKDNAEEYLLDVDGEEDTGALKRAKDREKQRADDAEKKAKELEKQLEESIDGDAKKKGDVAALEKSYQKKLADQKAEFDGKLTKRDEAIKKNLIDATANSLATAISKTPSLMAKAIKERLTVDFDSDEPALRILDAEGKVSALTIDDLKKEFLTNKEYAPIIIASKASGASSPTGKTASGGEEKVPLYKDMKPKDLVEQIKAKKEAQQ